MVSKGILKCHYAKTNGLFQRLQLAKECTLAICEPRHSSPPLHAKLQEARDAIPTYSKLTMWTEPQFSPPFLQIVTLCNCLLFLGVLNFAYFKFCFSRPLQQSAVEGLVQPTSLLFHPQVNYTWMMQPLPSIVPVDMKWREKEHQPSMPPVNQMDPGQIFKTAQVILYLEEPPHAAVDLETLVKRSALRLPLLLPCVKFTNGLANSKWHAWKGYATNRFFLMFTKCTKSPVENKISNPLSVRICFKANTIGNTFLTNESPDEKPARTHFMSKMRFSAKQVYFVWTKCKSHFKK